ncbi:hypothetical protein [Microtetraspora sp. NBRC 16547]|uniref:hypothetical protein n=1 Tax=Microtetraspora sp. NBRC 16547 TaxID=3030993 RepID=UPI002554C2C5|nr:hypothetical protein [Microtetraspora sp. NBRC 16547]
MTTPDQPGQNPQDWQSPHNPYGTDPQAGPSHGDPQFGQQYGQQYGPQYGQQPPYGQPYGQQAFGQPYGSPYGQPPYGYPPRQEGPRTHAIVALVISIVMGMTCYITLGGIAGAILSGIALSKVDTEPDTARRLLKWTWISIGINVVLIIIGIGAFIWAGVNGYFDATTTE